MDYSDLIKRSYPSNFFSYTEHTDPKYEIIDFEKILKHFYPSKELFIENVNLHDKLKIAYPNDCLGEFKKQNKLIEVKFELMKYY